MVTAIVLINCKPTCIHEIAAGLGRLLEIRDIHVVTGEYDIICTIQAGDNKSLSAIVTQHIVHINGVERTKTFLALETLK